MKCEYCNFETTELLSGDDAYAELKNHWMIEHPDEVVPMDVCITILGLNSEFKTPLDDLINNFFYIREKLSKRYLQTMLNGRNIERV